MDTKEAIRVIQCNRPASGSEMLREALDLAVSALQEQEQQRWIPVAERLPGPFERVIVCRDDGKVEQGYKDVGDWWKVYGTRTKQVTHWMPFPGAPDQEGAV